MLDSSLRRELAWTVWAPRVVQINQEMDNSFSIILVNSTVKLGKGKRKKHRKLRVIAANELL